jgi:hypothetical protein
MAAGDDSAAIPFLLATGSEGEPRLAAVSAEEQDEVLIDLSSRRQISATGATSSSVSPKSARTASARCTNSAIAE